MPTGPYPSYTHFLTWIETKRRDALGVFFVIFDLSLDFPLDGPPSLGPEDPRRCAGMISFLRSSEDNLQTEIGECVPV